AGGGHAGVGASRPPARTPLPAPPPPAGAIFSELASSRAAYLCRGALAAFVGACLPAASPAAFASATTGELARGRSLMQSRLLWSTIDVCNPSDQPNTVGIRGSMPGDGRPHDAMYMRFRLQYLNNAKHWTDLAGAASRAVFVGPGSSARQAGRTFPLAHRAGAALTLGGVVTFGGRSGAGVQAPSRTTTAGRHSLAGADPPNFSAATCSIG